MNKIYNVALKQLRKVGCAHTTGDGLRAMYAKLISQMHGGEAKTYFAWLKKTNDDVHTFELSRSILQDRQKAWDILLGIS